MGVHSRETPASQCTVTPIAGGGAQVESSWTWGGGGACEQDIHGESWIFIRKVLANRCKSEQNFSNYFLGDLEPRRKVRLYTYFF